MEEFCETGGTLHWRSHKDKSSYRQHQNTVVDDLPHREKIVPRNYDYRERHHLNHDGLHRRVLASVGRSWSKVYSEIVKFIKDNYRQDAWDSLFLNLSWWVEVAPMDIGGGVYVSKEGRPFYGKQLYVNPKSGLLMPVNPKWAQIAIRQGIHKNRDYSKDDVRYFGRKCFRRMNGLWYEVELVRLPNCPFHFGGEQADGWYKTCKIHDAVLKKDLSSWDRGSLGVYHGYLTYDGKMVPAEEYQKRRDESFKNWRFSTLYIPSDGHFVYAKSIRQLSKKELKDWGLPLHKQENRLPDIVRRKKPRRG